MSILNFQEKKPGGSAVRQNSPQSYSSDKYCWRQSGTISRSTDARHDALLPHSGEQLQQHMLEHKQGSNLNDWLFVFI